MAVRTETGSVRAAMQAALRSSPLDRLAPAGIPYPGQMTAKP